MSFDLIVLILTTVGLIMSPGRSSLWQLLFRQGIVYFMVAFVSNLIAQFANHPAQLKHQSGAVYVSSFAGDGCGWGVNGWIQAVKTGPGVQTKFFASYFNDPATNAQYAGYLDGILPVGQLCFAQTTVD